MKTPPLSCPSTTGAIAKHDKFLPVAFQDFWLGWTKQIETQWKGELQKELKVCGISALRPGTRATAIDSLDSCRATTHCCDFSYVGIDDPTLNS